MDECYICYDIETEIRPFMKMSPCQCKGTMVIHEHCAEILRSKGSCMQCHTPFPNKQCFDHMEYKTDRKRTTYYKTDKDGLKHGLSYIYTISDGRKMLYAITEYNHGIINPNIEIVFPNHEKNIDISNQLPRKSIRQEYIENQPIIDLN